MSKQSGKIRSIERELKKIREAWHRNAESLVLLHNSSRRQTFALRRILKWIEGNSKPGAEVRLTRLETKTGMILKISAILASAGIAGTLKALLSG